MKSVLEDMYVFDNFPYMHVVIDEGQDFGIEAVQETGIIEVLKSIITDINLIMQASIFLRQTSTGAIEKNPAIHK